MFFLDIEIYRTLCRAFAIHPNANHEVVFSAEAEA